MGQVEPVLALVTDLVARAARGDGVAARVDAVLDLVADAVDAEVGLVLQADPTHTVVRVLGRRLPAGSVDEVARAVAATGASDPLLDAVARGDLSPTTAQRAFGVRAWAASTQRAGCLRLCGVDQVAGLPLVGGPDFVIAMFGRPGEDFTDAHLRTLTALQPVAAGVAALAGLRPLTAGERPCLTARETEVLALLARGHTCSRIGRTLGASPRTVEVHLGHIYAKLGVRDRLSAVLAAYDLGLIPPRSPEPARTR